MLAKESVTVDETKRILSKSFLSHFNGCEQLEDNTIAIRQKNKKRFSLY